MAATKPTMPTETVRAEDLEVVLDVEADEEAALALVDVVPVAVVLLAAD